MSMILPALEYLHTEHPDSYQQVDSILSVEMDEDGSIEQYIQELLSKLKDTIPVTNSNLPQYHIYIIHITHEIIFYTYFVSRLTLIYKPYCLSLSLE